MEAENVIGASAITSTVQQMSISFGIAIGSLRYGDGLQFDHFSIRARGR